MTQFLSLNPLVFRPLSSELWGGWDCQYPVSTKSHECLVCPLGTGGGSDLAQWLPRPYQGCLDTWGGDTIGCGAQVWVAQCLGHPHVQRPPPLSTPWPPGQGSELMLLPTGVRDLECP